MSVQLPETPKFLIEERTKKVTKKVTSTPVVKIPATAKLLQEQLAKFDEETRIEEEFAKKNRERAQRKKEELERKSQMAVQALRVVKAAEEAAKEAQRREEHQRQEGEKKKQAEIEAGLSWKNLLVSNQNKELTRFERDWGLLCERARGLAPETNWYFLLMNTQEVNTPAVANWRNWLERFICSYEWHSPREVEVVLSQDKGRVVFTISWKKSDLPPPLFITLSDWTISQTAMSGRVGFKMTYTGSFISDKAGIA